MMSDNGTALAVLPTTPNASTQLEPSTAEQAFWLATQLVKSGLLGKGITKPEAAFAVILAGRELGLTAMQSLRSIHIIEGKPCLSADLMVALVKRSPVCKSFKLVESTNTVATYSAERVGEGVTTMSFTMDDAKLAGVTGKQNWKTYPAAMLRARCIAALARVVYPDLLMGIYEQDEIGQTNAMPSQRESGPIASAPVVTEAVIVDDEVVDFWGARLDAAENMDDLDVVRAQVKSALDKPTDKPTLDAIARHYKVRKESLGGK